MAALLLYIIKSTICLALFYVGFKALLSNDTFFHFNRWVLLVGVAVCVLLPFVRLKTAEPLAIQQPMIHLEELITGEEIIAQPLSAAIPSTLKVATEKSTLSIDWSKILIVIYLLGCLKIRLTQYIRGWITYYRYADMKDFVIHANKWCNRRIRMYIWKSWKLVRTRFANLMKCGINRFYAWQWANTRKGYWRIAGSWMLHRAITSENLIRAGYPSIVNIYNNLHRN